VSAASRYRYLFSPLRVGPVVVRNRIVFSAHLTNFAEDGLPSQQHADYYAARAAGGVGLIITEEHSTHPTDWPYEKLIHGFHRAVIPGYQNITTAVHAHDVPIFAQLNHNGGQASSMFSRLPVWAPSPVPDPMFREVPKAVERRGGRLRRHRAAVLALLHRPRLPVDGHEQAHRCLWRQHAGPGPDPAGDH
jgi:2,4-dienoyl-CoA reductase-like NADH-dependent reductase (Old Yellow Enzyme family)